MSSPVRSWHWGEPIAALREVLDAGGVLAIPTESSYGLAVDPRNPQGVEAIYDIKRRERGKPLPVVAADRQQVVALGVSPEEPMLQLGAAHWPAALSVILPLAAPLAATGGEATLAVRVPAHRRLLDLLTLLGCALTATSANRSGEPPILDPRDLQPLLAERAAIIVDGGVLAGGPPSTMIAESAEGTMKILRRGAYPIERLAGSVHDPISQSE